MWVRINSRLDKQKNNTRKNKTGGRDASVRAIYIDQEKDEITINIQVIVSRYQCIVLGVLYIYNLNCLILTSTLFYKLGC
jgi:hypothetical protein